MGVPYAEVIGDPVAHSKSPAIQKFWLEQLGLEADYRATQVAVDQLPDYLAARRLDPDWRGCNLTMPLKVEAVEHLDEMNDIVARLGATNCISPRRGGLYGTNFDAEAVLQSLVQIEWNGRAVLVGTGGAARAALWALALLGFDAITIMSRNSAGAAALAEAIGVEVDFATLGGAPQCDLLVNATPLGMKGKPSLPLAVDAMSPGAAVFEMVYDPLVTPLISDAAARGLRVFDGLSMLIEQASMSFVSFFNRAITSELRAAARERVAG
jgi:shikimate dehydrogenase